MDTIRQLDQCSRADTSFVGSKAAALGELIRAGFQVPRGFVLTTAAYAQLIQPLRERINTRLTPEVIFDPAEVETAASEIREWIERLEWSAPLRAQLEAALAQFTADSHRTHSFAVRTSLPSDDLATAFGGGVERAYLGQVGADEIARAAARGWAGLWNSRAMYYRHRKKIAQTAAALAVLIQPMIYADAAGVMFTQNPLSGNRDEIQIDSIWGLGAPLMNARLRPDRFLVARPSRTIIARTLEEKSVQLVVGADGHTEQQSVDDAHVLAPSLDERQILALAELGIRIADYFREPQEIEWARAADEIFILQARPISMRRS